MKKQIDVFSLLLAMLVLVSCGDDDSSPANRIKADGNTVKFSKAYLINEETTNDDDEDGYMHRIYLTGDGLTIDVEEEEFDGSGNMANFAILSQDEEIEEGTYEISADADFGEAVAFVMATDSDGTSSFDEAYQAVSGKIKVSKSGNKYTFKFDFDEFVMADGEGGTEEGEGSIKGSYSGKLEVLAIDGGARKPKNPLAEIF